MTLLHIDLILNCGQYGVSRLLVMLNELTLKWGTRIAGTRSPLKIGSRSKRITKDDPSLQPARAILDMKNQRDKLRQYQKRITVITSREQEIARECLRSGNKQKALLALRRKKYQESLLAKTDQQLAQLEALTSDVEFALVQKDVVFGLQQGTAVLKEIHKEMGGLEKVEMIMGESEEAQAYQKVSAFFIRVTTIML